MKKHYLFLFVIACMFVSCKPKAEKAVVKTLPITNITGVSAQSGGDVVSDGGAEVTERGVCWATSQNPNIDNERTSNGAGLGSYTSDITKLTENTTYYVRAYAVNSAGISYGEELTFVTLESIGLPEVITSEITEITQTSAVCLSEVKSDGGAEVTARGICWSMSQNPTLENEHTIDSLGTGVFSSYMTALSPNTQYYVRAYATNSKGTSYGNEIVFMTLIDTDLPLVTTSAVKEITQTSAIVEAEVVSDGGAEVTARGICWSTSHNPTIDNEHSSEGTGLGAYQSQLTELTPNTTYYVRAYAANDKGTSYGEEMSFTTLANTELPSVTTTMATEITETSAISGGAVTDDGGTEVVARGICWSTSQNPTIDNEYTSDGAGMGDYQSVMTDLMPNTMYFVRAYATNSEGTAYGEEISFTTLSAAELPAVATTAVTEITQTSAVGGGDVTDDGGAEVTARGVCWSISPNPTLDDEYTSDGGGLGDYQSVMDNLMPNTTYYVRAYATNNVGTAYGDELSFTTLDDGTINGYEYVDLGLPSGVKWATMNVGAASHEESGEYYAWGEIAPKAEYTEANCTSYGLNMEDVSGNPERDAATAMWGSTWRTPTKEECEELLNNCTWEWDVQNGVGGKKVTGPNGNHIFLPVTGYKYGNSIYVQDYGYYWSSTPISTYENYSYDFFFDEPYNLSMRWDDRCYGQPIRPVSD